MGKNRLITLSIRKMKKTMRRFLSLGVLSCLGVTAFVGIKMSNPAMMESINTYYRLNNVYDIKVISTLGLTDNDITSLSQIDDNLKVYGSHSKDIQCHTDSKSAIIKFLEITDDVNKISVVEGRMPENNSEIIIEKGIMTKLGLKLGEKLSLEVPEEDSTINTKEVTLVGIVTSPIYVLNSNGNINRGNTNIGLGEINFYGYVRSDFFNMDYYTEIYITSPNEFTTNSDEYNQAIELVMDKVSQIKKIREKARRDEIVHNAMNEIEKNENEGLNQFSEIKQQLDEANIELENGREKLEVTELQLSNAKNQLNYAKNEIETGYEQIQSGEEELNNAKNELEFFKNEIENAVAPYNLTYNDICFIIELVEGRNLTEEEVVELLPTDLKCYDNMVNMVHYLYDNGCESVLRKFIKEIGKQELIQAIPNDIENYDEMVNYINGLNDSEIRKKIIAFFLSEKYIETIKAEIPVNMIHYDDMQKALDDYEILAGKLIELYNNVKQLQNGFSLYEEKMELLECGKEKLEEARQQYTNALETYNYGVREYNNGKKIYNDNLNLYNSQVEEYNSAFANFNEEIQNAKNKANSIENAKWYIYDRMDNSDYASYIDSAESVERLATIFPTVFFVVAIFISSLSMARMAIEDRSEIGTLKSLGYGNMSIRGIYVFYAALATVIGGILGSSVGFFMLPKVVFNTYKMMYEMPVFMYSNNLLPIFIGITISLICICGATIITINSLVKEKTTNLLRPLSPNKGKKILIENVKFIWDKLNFSNKITIRNIFRYKKRVGMTILGIIGCTTLLLSGYAIRDSIVSIGDKNFGEIFVFDEMLYLDGKLNETELNQIMNDNRIKEKLYTKMSTVEVEKNSVNLFIPNDAEKIEDIVHLRDSKTKKKLKLEKDKVIVTSKLAKMLRLKVNDNIHFTDSEMHQYSFIISDIAENYVGNYIYMDKQTYEKNIDKYDINVCYIKLNDETNEKIFTKELLSNHSNIISSNSSKSILERFNKIFGALDSVVVILVVLSGALSFVVLYNLVYVSISERQREIATLKVLGFNHKEVDLYIIKEETIISIIGILIGLFIGTWFSQIIVETIEINTVQFVKQILLKSYLLTSGFMILFKLIVNIRVHFALKRINMIESLKNIE